MIDFEYATYNELQPFEDYTFTERIQSIFLPGEETMSVYRGNRGRIVAFTNKRIIATSLQSIRTKKVDYSTLPYRTIRSFSVEAMGDLNIDSGLEIMDEGLRRARFEFSGQANVAQICKVIGEHVL